MLTLGKNLRYSLALKSEPESITVLDNLLVQFAKNHKLNTHKYADACVAIGEALNNAIYHGNKLNNDKKVSLELLFLKNQTLYCTISDEGLGFDYNNLPNPTLPHNIEKLTGRGVFIMRYNAYKCAFNAAGNKVEMQFLLS